MSENLIIYVGFLSFFSKQDYIMFCSLYKEDAPSDKNKTHDLFLLPFRVHIRPLIRFLVLFINLFFSFIN